MDRSEWNFQEQLFLRVCNFTTRVARNTMDWSECDIQEQLSLRVSNLEIAKQYGLGQFLIPIVNINSHVKIYWDEKSFGCHSRTLMSKDTQMKNHLTASYVTRNFQNSLARIHSDEKPFGCYSCEKNFLQTPNFKYTLMKNRIHSE